MQLSVMDGLGDGVCDVCVVWGIHITILSCSFCSFSCSLKKNTPQRIVNLHSVSEKKFPSQKTLISQAKVVVLPNKIECAKSSRAVAANRQNVVYVVIYQLIYHDFN